MRMHRLRITGVIGVSAALLGSTSAAIAAQQPVTSAALPVIVILKSQLAAAPAGTAASSHRMAVSSAEQAPLISAAVALGAKNVRQYQLVNSFAANVSPQALTELAANPSVAAVIPDVTIHGDLGGADPAPAGLAPAGRTSATPKNGAGGGLSPKVIPGACSDSRNGLLAPEGLSLTGTASDNKSQPTARSLGFTGAGVKVAVLSDGLDPDNVNFIRPDGLSVFSRRVGGDYKDFTGLGPGAPTSGAEAFVDSSQIAAQGRHVYNLNGYTAQSYPHACNIRIEGVAPGAALVGLDVFADAGQQVSPLSTVLQAINYAVETDHVNVINESIAVDEFPDINSLDVFQRFNDAAVAAGVTVVVPTDDGGPANTISSPATDPDVISVGASTQFQTQAQSNLAAARYFAKGWVSDNISAMSSSGFEETGGTLDLVAPGDASWASCTADLAKFQRCINFFGNAADLFLVGGTSESGPFVSGAAALVIQAYQAGHHGASPSPALVKQILTSTATDLGAVGSAQGAGLLNSYQAVRLAESIHAPRHVGDTLLLSSSQLNAVGAASSKHSWPVTITNAGSSTQHVSLAGRTLGADTGVRSGAETLSNSNSPKFVDVSGTENNYREFHFTVAKAIDQLTGSVAWRGNPASCLQAFCEADGNDLVSMILINPRGDLAAWTFPEGPGSFGRATVQHPMAGTWTGVISSPIGTSNPATSGATGTVRWQIAAQRYAPFGAVSPSHITLAPGQHATITVRAGAPAAPGDASGSIVVRWPGGTGTTIAVMLRARVSVARGGGFSGTLTGGNGWVTAQGQEQYYQFSVPRGTRDLRADVRLSNDAADPVIEYLVSPDGDIAGYGENGIGQPGTTGAVSTLGASAYSVNPVPGNWTLIIEFAEPVVGNELSQRYSGDIVFNASSAAAPTLPDSAATTLKAGTAVTVPVTITNHGASPQKLFLDPRLDTTATMMLPTIPPTTSEATLPNTGQFPEWLVPNETSSLTVSQTSTIPAMFDVGTATGDPDLASSAPGAGPLCAPTASVTYAPPGAAVTPGIWLAGPAGCGPYTGPGAAGTATSSMSIHAKAFDPTITAPLGDYNLTAIHPNATPKMIVLWPGHSIVVPVTITPSGTAGSVVRGTLYIEALVGGLLPVGQTSGVEMAALPYEYTIG
jgi:Subtilase family/Peptidase inhibitor I9